MRSAARAVPSAIADMVASAASTASAPATSPPSRSATASTPSSSRRSWRRLRPLPPSLLGEAEAPTPSMVRGWGLRRGMGLRWDATEAIREALALLGGEPPRELPEELASLLWMTTMLCRVQGAGERGGGGRRSARRRRRAAHRQRPLQAHLRKAVARVVGRSIGRRRRRSCPSRGARCASPGGRDAGARADTTRSWRSSSTPTATAPTRASSPTPT